MEKKEPKPRKLRWNGKPAFCVWDGIGVGLTLVLFFYPIRFFVMLTGLLPITGGMEQLLSIGLVSAVLVLVGFVYFLVRRRRMLTITSGFLMTGVILCMIASLYFIVVAGASIFPLIYQSLYGES